jgi:hypothetical protein
VIAWIECTGRLPYLAAIVDSVEDAVRVQGSMPSELAERCRLHTRQDLARPCFIVEGSDGFAVCSADEAQARIVSYLRSGSLDDEDRRVTLYRIVDPFLPSQAGRDEMGRIPHTHPGATEASLIAERGIASVWGS